MMYLSSAFGQNKSDMRVGSPRNRGMTVVSRNTNVSEFASSAATVATIASQNLNERKRRGGRRTDESCDEKSVGWIARVIVDKHTIDTIALHSRIATIKQASRCNINKNDNSDTT